MRRSGLPFSPTEAHAIAIGMFSGGVADARQQWHAAVYAELDPNDALAQECKALLDELFAAAKQQATDVEFGLQLFMPPAGASYTAAMALRDWAQGFLYGFGLAGEQAAQRLSAEGQEALRDFYEIAQLDAEAEQPGEDDQAALMEIEEYMRVAAMLIFEDMHAGIAAEQSHELH